MRTGEATPTVNISLNERCPFCSKRLILQKIKEDIFKSCLNCSDYKNVPIFVSSVSSEETKEDVDVSNKTSTKKIPTKKSSQNKLQNVFKKCSKGIVKNSRKKV